MTYTIRFVQLFFKIISIISPRIAGKLALNLFQKPHFKKTRTRELALYEEFEEKRIPNENEDLFIYEKGKPGAHPVLLVHGWDSNPGSMYGIAKKLHEQGLRVIVMGLPAHGHSKLSKTNMFDSAIAIQQIISYFGIENDFSMVTHSFGSGASIIALKDSSLRANQLVFLTSTDVMLDVFVEFANMIHLGKKAFAHLLKKTEEIVGIKMDKLVISDLISKVHFKNLTIFHDKDDKILPYKNALAIKNKVPMAKLITLTRMGHYRLLWDEEVIDMIVAQIKSRKKR